jgi:hypothetical protein
VRCLRACRARCDRSFVSQGNSIIASTGRGPKRTNTKILDPSMKTMKDDLLKFAIEGEFDVIICNHCRGTGRRRPHLCRVWLSAKSLHQ